MQQNDYKIFGESISVKQPIYQLQQVNLCGKQFVHTVTMIPLFANITQIGAIGIFVVAYLKNMTA